MKKLMFALTLALSFNALALSRVSVLSVTQSGNMMPGPGRQEHRVHTSIQIRYESCAKFTADNFDFKLSENEKNQNGLNVFVKPNVFDCMGGFFMRTQEITTMALPVLDTVIVNQGNENVSLEVVHHFAF